MKGSRSQGPARGRSTPAEASPARISEKWFSVAVLACVMAVQAIVLAPELRTAHVQNNDYINHITLTAQMVHEVERGGNPLDFWSPEIAMGVPMARTYQPLGHLLGVVGYFVLGKAMPVVTVLNYVRFTCILLLPLCFYACLLLLEFPPLTAAAGALLLPLVAGPGDGMLGLDLRSWMMHGVYPQLVATNLLLLAIGLAWRAIRTGKGIAMAGAVLGLTCLAHLMYGWMGALTACLIAVIPDPAARVMVRVRRTVAIGLVALVLSLFQLIPLLTDGWLINHSRQELASKFDSYGAQAALGWLFRGELMDGGARIPVLTVVALLSVAVLLFRRKFTARELLLLAGFAVWLLIFFGRATWGPLVAVLGVGADFHLSRVIATVQIFLLMLAAAGLGALWREIGRRWSPVAAAILTLILLAPMAIERFEWVQEQEEKSDATLAALRVDGPDVDRALSAALQRGGRMYAGLPHTYAVAFLLGSMPVYGLSALKLVPTLGFSYNESVFAADSTANFTESRPSHYRLFNVKTVIMPPSIPSPPFLVPAARFGRFGVLEAPATGYFGLVDVAAAAKVTRMNVYDINKPWVRSGWPDADQYVRLDFHDEPPAGLAALTPGSPLPPAPPAGAPAGTVSNERQTGQVYEADLDVARPAWTVFRMSYHFSWKAYIDGVPQPTAMLTPGFLGVQMAPGRHHIVCRYEPGNWKIYLAAAGFAITMLLVIVERCGTPRAGSHWQ